MRTYQQITAGTINSPKAARERPLTSDGPVVIDVKGDAMNVTLDTGLRKRDATPSPNASYSVSRRRGPL